MIDLQAPPAELIISQVDQNPEVFERWVMLRMLADPQFALKTCNIVFFDSKMRPAMSFQDPKLKLLAWAAATYHYLQGPVQLQEQNGMHYLQFSYEHFYTCFVQAAGGHLSETIVRDHMELLNSILPMVHSSYKSIKMYTTEALLHWLREIRMANIIESAVQNAWSSVRWNEEVQAEMQHLRGLGSQQFNLYAFGQANEDMSAGLERFACSIGMLNHKIGGGFVRGEACLMAGPSNAGKSVLASQLLGELAMQKRRCLYVTTERTQPKRTIEAKIVSQLADIPYSLISTGVNPSRLNPDQQKRLEALFSRINQHNMYIVHWWESPSDNYEQHFKMLCQQAGQLMGGLDCFVFDWIGATLTADVQGDSAKVRLAYQKAADTFAAVTSDLDVFGVVMAQASAQQCLRAKLVGPEHLAECKTMHREMPTMVGISGLPTEDTTGNPDAPRLHPDQFLNVAKTRHGVGGGVPVTRDFGYQRFKPRIISSNEEKQKSA